MNRRVISSLTEPQASPGCSVFHEQRCHTASQRWLVLFPSCGYDSHQSFYRTTLRCQKPAGVFQPLCVWQTTQHLRGLHSKARVSCFQASTSMSRNVARPSSLLSCHR